MYADVESGLQPYGWTTWSFVRARPTDHVVTNSILPESVAAVTAAVGLPGNVWGNWFGASWVWLIWG